VVYGNSAKTNEFETHGDYVLFQYVAARIGNFFITRKKNHPDTIFSRGREFKTNPRCLFGKKIMG
jgi:hypothetical protein